MGSAKKGSLRGESRAMESMCIDEVCRESQGGSES